MKISGWWFSDSASLPTLFTKFRASVKSLKTNFRWMLIGSKGTSCEAKSSQSRVIFKYSSASFLVKGLVPPSQGTQCFLVKFSISNEVKNPFHQALIHLVEPNLHKLYLDSLGVAEGFSELSYQFVPQVPDAYSDMMENFPKDSNHQSGYKDLWLLVSQIRNED